MAEPAAYFETEGHSRTRVAAWCALQSARLRSRCSEPDRERSVTRPPLYLDKVSKGVSYWPTR
jgi:hypothetical protein